MVRHRSAGFSHLFQVTQSVSGGYRDWGGARNAKNDLTTRIPGHSVCPTAILCRDECADVNDLDVRLYVVNTRHDNYDSDVSSRGLNVVRANKPSSRDRVNSRDHG